MRKLIHIAFGVLKSDKPFDPDYGENGLNHSAAHTQLRDNADASINNQQDALLMYAGGWVLQR